jgi:hypothetical protein
MSVACNGLWCQKKFGLKLTFPFARLIGLQYETDPLTLPCCKKLDVNRT